MKTRSLIRLLPVIVAVVAGCDSGSSPVAPDGTLISISANPSLIAPFATSEIQVVALHASGVPIRTGTEFRFTATGGSVDPVVAATDGDGIARTIFRSDGRSSASVTATSGAQGQYTTAITIEDTELVAAFVEVITGLTVNFTDASTGQQPPTAWEWSFGDGAGSSQRNPEHTYAQPGTYTVRLTVSNPEASDSTSRPIDVEEGLEIEPVASFLTSIDGLTGTFLDTSSNDPTSWSWDFGDGGRSSQQHPVHTYDDSGTYVVSLTASNGGGADTHAEFITVTASQVDPPVASFVEPVNANGLTVLFEDSSSNEPTSWSWDFGDGGTSHQQDPIHTYAVAGTYVVSLTARNAGGADTYSAFVTVSDL